jgi:hypothetical protein
MEWRNAGRMEGWNAGMVRHWTAASLKKLGEEGLYRRRWEEYRCLDEAMGVIRRWEPFVDHPDLGGSTDLLIHLLNQAVKP